MRNFFKGRAVFIKKITIITGHYGSGKTNLAVNMAVKTAECGESTAIVDLDIVNPYFRTADFGELFREKNVTMIAPDFANTNLDIPSVQFDVEQLAMNYDRLVIDVGGDDAGAFALGRYAQALEKFGDSLEMLYVVNQRRYLTSDSGEAVSLMYEIEKASRMHHTAVVNNTNLGCETTAETVRESAEFAEEVCKKTGLPLAFTTIPENIADRESISEIFPVKIYVKPIWEL